jgi:hypothetical protein
MKLLHQLIVFIIAILIITILSISIVKEMLPRVNYMLEDRSITDYSIMTDTINNSIQVKYTYIDDTSVFDTVVLGFSLIMAVFGFILIISNFLFDLINDD